MSTQTCVICRRTHRDTLACRLCVDRIVADLRAVPDLVLELDVTITRQDQHGRDPGHSAEIPLAYREHATIARDALRNTVTTWARLLADDHGHCRHVDTSSLALFLARWPSWIAQHEAADDLAGDLSQRVQAARRAIDRPTDTRIYLGPCDLRDPDNPPCREEVWAVRGRDVATCRVCGAEWSVAQRQVWLADQVQYETATAEVLAGFLRRIGIEITPADVQNAARRGELSNVGIDSHSKRRRYQVSDVLERFLPGRRAARYLQVRPVGAYSAFILGDPGPGLSGDS